MSEWHKWAAWCFFMALFFCLDVFRVKGALKRIAALEAEVERLERLRPKSELEKALRADVDANYRQMQQKFNQSYYR